MASESELAGDHRSDSESGESDSSSSSSSDSSDSEIEYVKPVVVKKRKLPPSSSSVDHSNNLDERVAFSNSVRQLQQNLRRDIDDNYTSTDKELLYRIHQLVDLDGIEPEEEKLQWEQRQRARLQRERDILLKKQRTLEESQARRG